MTGGSGARDLVARLMDGYLGTQLVYVATRLGLADLLANRPQPADRLADAERTAAEVSGLLARAGFALRHAAPASGRTGTSIIEAGCA
jgi:hypothetical protein